MSKGKLKKAVNKLLNKTDVDEKILTKLNNLLDKTEIDEKIVMKYLDAKESGLLDKISCYIKCYGAYVLAVGAGCTFGVNNWIGLVLLGITAGWAWWTTRGCKSCND